MGLITDKQSTDGKTRLTINVLDSSYRFVGNEEQACIVVNIAPNASQSTKRFISDNETLESFNTLEDAIDANTLSKA